MKKIAVFCTLILALFAIVPNALAQTVGVAPQIGSSGNGFYVTPEGQQAIDRGNVVSTMLDSMPENGYQGTYFNLNFSFKTGLYTLTLQSAYPQQGQQEFSGFLAANNIGEPSWFGPNLKVIIQ